MALEPAQMSVFLRVAWLTPLPSVRGGFLTLPFSVEFKQILSPCATNVDSAVGGS